MDSESSLRILHQRAVLASPRLLNRKENLVASPLCLRKKKLLRSLCKSRPRNSSLPCWRQAKALTRTRQAFSASCKCWAAQTLAVHHRLLQDRAARVNQHRRRFVGLPAVPSRRVASSTRRPRAREKYTRRSRASSRRARNPVTLSHQSIAAWPRIRMASLACPCLNRHKSHRLCPFHRATSCLPNLLSQRTVTTTHTHRKAAPTSRLAAVHLPVALRLPMSVFKTYLQHNELSDLRPRTKTASSCLVFCKARVRAHDQLRNKLAQAKTSTFGLASLLNLTRLSRVCPLHLV